MSKRKTRLLALILALLFLMGLCTACSSRTRRVITLGVYAGNYWGTPSNDSYQVLDDAIARFEARHPGLTVEYVSGISTDSYSEWLAGGILKGEEPDVFFVLPEDFDLLVSAGALEPLDTWMEMDGGFDASVYYDTCLHAGKSGGKQYALPYESVPTMMFVNKTLLEAHGLDVPANNWTWEDFYDICQKVTDLESHQFGVYDYSWVNALYSNGAELFSEDGSACYLSDEKIQQSIRFVQRLEELNQGYTVTARDFDLGNVAFRPFLFSEYRAYQPYPWRVKKYSGFEWACVCMPAGPEGGNISELNTMLVGISARSRHTDLAWAFLKQLTYDTQTQQNLYTTSHGISPLISVAESPEILQALYDNIPGSVDFSPEVIGNIMETAAIRPQFDGYRQALTMAEQAVSDALSGSGGLHTQLISSQREINIFLSQS